MPVRTRRIFRSLFGMAMAALFVSNVKLENRRTEHGMLLETIAFKDFYKKG